MRFPRSEGSSFSLSLAIPLPQYMPRTAKRRAGIQQVQLPLALHFHGQQSGGLCWCNGTRAQRGETIATLFWDRKERGRSRERAPFQKDGQKPSTEAAAAAELKGSSLLWWRLEQRQPARLDRSPSANLLRLRLDGLQEAAGVRGNSWAGRPVTPPPPWNRPFPHYYIRQASGLFNLSWKGGG